MWKHTAFAIVVSVLLSAMSSLMVVKYQGHAPSDTVRVKKLELVDDHGAVRGVLEVRPSREGEQLPRLVLFNDEGRDAIAIGLGPSGRGYLGIVNNDAPIQRSAINLGYLYLDDTVPHSPAMTGWGLLVGNKNRRTLMGISEAGQPLGLSSLQTGALGPAK
jgi:hypothetical protein